MECARRGPSLFIVSFLFVFSLFDLSGPRSVFLNISPWPGSFLPYPHPLNPVCHPFLLHLIPSSSGLILTPPQLGRIPFTRSQCLCFSFLPRNCISPFLAPPSLTSCPFLLFLLLFVPCCPISFLLSPGFLQYLCSVSPNSAL